MTEHSSLIQDWKMITNIQINSNYINTESVLSILDAFQRKWVFGQGDSSYMNAFVHAAHQSFLFANSIERIKSLLSQGNTVLQENLAALVKELKFIEVFGINTQNLMQAKELKAAQVVIKVIEAFHKESDHEPEYLQITERAIHALSVLLRNPDVVMPLLEHPSNFQQIMFVIKDYRKFPRIMSQALVVLRLVISRSEAKDVALQQFQTLAQLIQHISAYSKNETQVSL